MGLGSTTKKIQNLADRAEQLYAQIDEVREQLTELRNKLDTTHETVSTLEVKHEQNRALLKALAEEQGIDAEEVLTEAAIEEPENESGTESEKPTDGDDPTATTETEEPAESEAN